MATATQRADRITGRVLREATAWDLIGWDDGLIRLRGGRALYEAVMYNCARDGRCVKIARLEADTQADGRPCVREVSRYVDPTTVVEVMEEHAE